MPRQQDLIEGLLGDNEQTIDRSLRGQALRRADNDQIPRTLTAWEWEEYYQQHGQPEAHTATDGKASPTWRARFRQWWRLPDRKQ